MPFFNTVDAISATLAALDAQNIPAGWSVRLIVVDDGSTSEASALLQQELRKMKLPLVLRVSPHVGPAKARNLAISTSKADIIFLLGADIVLRPGALAAHLSFHTQNPEVNRAALGFIQWDPRQNPTLLMEWLVHSGPQNDFDCLLGQKEADPCHHFTAANTSIKRKILVDEMFSTEFEGYGWEDIELGRRLFARGLRLAVLSDALALHSHYYSPRAVAARQRAAGYGLCIYQRLHPEVELLPVDSKVRQLKHFFWKVSGLLFLSEWVVGYMGKKRSLPGLFSMWTTWYFWQGIRQEKGLK